MKWPGPLHAGITQSLINRFLECPYRFYLYACLGLEELGEPEPNLIYGDTGHKGLEHIIRRPYRMIDFSPDDWVEIDSEIDAHISKYWPMAPATFPISIKRMIRLYDDSYKDEHGPFVAEKEFAIPYLTSHGHNVTLRGKIDGIADDGFMVEHKFKGRFEPKYIRQEIQVDQQLMIYSHVSGSRSGIYDTIKIPDTQWAKPPQRKMERPSSYINSLYDDREWGDYPISRKRHLWISQIPYDLESDDITKYFQFTVDPLIDRICKWYEHVQQPGFDPDNPKFYNHIFYKTPVRHFNPSNTEMYKCNYYNYLTGQITLDDLVPVKAFYAELKQETPPL